jgi:hypothetical protein
MSTRSYWKYQSEEARQARIKLLEEWAKPRIGTQMRDQFKGLFTVASFEVGKNLNGVWFYSKMLEDGRFSHYATYMESS